MNIENRSFAFRDLTADEIELVSGGNQNEMIIAYQPQNQDPEIVVNGVGGGGGTPGYGGFGGGGGGGYESGGIDNSGDYDGPEEQELAPIDPKDIATALSVLDAKVTIVDAILEKFGPNQLVQIGPDGPILKAGDLLDGLSKLTNVLQGATLAYGIYVGDSNFHNAINFAFGIVVTEAAVAGGLPGLYAAGLGIAANVAADNLFEWMEAIGDQRDELVQYVDKEIAEFVRDNSNYQNNTGGDYVDPVDVYNGMLGNPGGGSNEDIYDYDYQ